MNGYATSTTELMLPAGTEGHFRLHVYAVISRILANLHALDTSDSDPFAVFPFLYGYEAALRECWPPGLDAAYADAWWNEQIADWERAEAQHLPLRALHDDLDLSVDALRLFIAAGLVEEDIRFGALFAALQAPLDARRPCVGLLGWLIAPAGQPASDAWPACRRLIDCGLLQVENQADPRAEWVLRVPPALWDAVRQASNTSVMPNVTIQRDTQFPQLDALVLPHTLRAQVTRLPGLLATNQIDALALRGMRGSGRRTIAGAIARALGHDLLLWERTGADDPARLIVGPLATLSGALPLLRCDPGPGETLELPTLGGYTGPVVIALGRSGGLSGPLVQHALSLTLPLPDAPARARFWRASGVPIDAATLAEIAARFQLNGGYIHRAATLAAAYAALGDRSSLDVDDVQQAARALGRQALDTLTTVLDPISGWDELIVGSSTGAELLGLEARCRARETLREEAGPAFSSSLNRGVRAMFSGPSGTGKTLGARALAGALHMDIYRVDLAAVVNKYIGETERNLNQVLSRAEELDVLLLLDEGDALMTGRTEVRSANDRYANLETNYLLQRLESYEGIVVITTNASQRIDSAFLRRLDVTVEFAPPEAEERHQIWRLHLPAQHALDPALLQEVAARCALTGGQIRNAALHATLLALGTGAQLGTAHLEAALVREYRTAGAAYPLRAHSAEIGQLGRLRQFAGEL